MKNTNTRNLKTFIPTLALGLFMLPDFAFAHEGGGAVGGFVSGFTHPIFGFDHVIAMVAVGLWGALLKKPAIWLLPLTFPIAMAFGGVLGIRDVPLPGIEIGIATSGIVLGVLVAAAAAPPLWLAAVVVGVFAIFHGHAHGTELPESATPIAYGVGFVISTGLLHALGIAIGLLDRWKWGVKVIRALGGVIALLGAWYLVGALSG